MFIGSFVGGYIPSLFGAGFFSFWGLIFSGLGGLAGIYVGYKLSKNF
jgi:hypothetical protein